MDNTRRKGKIAKPEWPSIVQRFNSGETLASIARDYNCTAPAIRYILNRGTETGPPVRKRDPVRKPAGGDRLVDMSEVLARRAQKDPARTSLADLRARVVRDIAIFLVTFDNLDLSRTESLAGLREGCDLLMRSVARILIEVEKLREAAPEHGREAATGD